MGQRSREYDLLRDFIIILVTLSSVTVEKVENRGGGGGGGGVQADVL